MLPQCEGGDSLGFVVGLAGLGSAFWKCLSGFLQGYCKVYWSLIEL